MVDLLQFDLQNTIICSRNTSIYKLQRRAEQQDTSSKLQTLTGMISMRDLTVSHEQEQKLEMSWELELQMDALRVLSLLVGPSDCYADT